MRTLASPITLLFLFSHLIGNAQINIQRIGNVDPILKQVAAKYPGLRMFSRKGGQDGYVNMAVLNENNRQLKWFTCYGTAFDSVQLEKDEFSQLAAGMPDPFVFYRSYCYEQLFYIEQAELMYRVRGKAALMDTFPNSRAVFNFPTVKSAESSLQKLMAIEGLMKRIWLQLRLLDSKSPRLLSQYRNVGSHTWRRLAGAMIKKSDSTEYYNTDPIAVDARIVLRRHSPGGLFVYDREGKLVDSIPLKPGKYASLLKEKEDVFLLYRGWLELQWQQVTDNRQQYTGWLRKLDSSQYSLASRVEDLQQIRNALVVFREQQIAISNKISNLIIPRKECIEQLLAAAYPDEGSEISYLPALGFSYTISYQRGKKVYELGDHRGNVMAVISDRKKGMDENADGSIDYYNADVVSANDYYPFGMLQPGRSYSTNNKYRYGYNGKENDNEVKGEGNQQDYGMRIYDPRVARFLSTDPLTKSFPLLTPYQYASNRPIEGIDLDGMELFPTIKQLYSSGNGAKIKVVADAVIKVKIINLSAAANSELDMNSIRMNIENSMETALSGEHTASSYSFFTTEKMTKGLARVKQTSENKGQDVTFKVDVNAEVTVVNNIEDIGANDWVFAIVDKVNDNSKQENAGIAQMLGKVAIGEAENFTQKNRSDLGKQLALHEILHLLGADDIYDKADKKNQKNAMNSIGPLNNGLLNSEQVVNEVWTQSMGTWNYIWQGFQNDNYKKPTTDAEKTDTKTQLKEFINKNGTAARVSP